MPSTGDEPLISIRRLTKRFPGVAALTDVSLDIRPGECHAIVGENGAGKSTLMKCLSGIITDHTGEIVFRGRQIAFAGPLDAQRAGIGMIHQELNLVEGLSVAANLFLGREKRSRLGLLDDRAMERAAAELLGQLECDVAPRQLVGRLRVGDQQLVEIAKALSLQSAVLIMDEPTSALTGSETVRLFRVIERLRGRGVTILYISHKLDEVFRLADRITVLRDGQLVRTLDTAATAPREVTHLMVGRTLDSSSVRTARAAGEPLLEVRRLSLPWPGHARQWRLREVSFSLRRGEIVGLAGLMGAGRTELLECLYGCSSERPAGEIVLEGRPIVVRGPAVALGAGIALVTEDRKRLGIFPNLGVGKNISVATLKQFSRLGWIGRRQETDRVSEMAKDLGIKTPTLAAPVTGLSGGNQQKAILGRALLARPKVLLLDDPTRGVDVGAKAELYQIIDRLCREGLGVLVTSSELPELLALCDRILVLCEGELAGELSREEATESRIMELATSRRAAAGSGVRSIFRL